MHDCGRLPRTNADHGIYVEQARATVIEDNWIYRNADRGIQLYPNAQGTVIRRNVIHGNGTGLVFSGAFGQASSGARVEQNVLTGSAARYNVESYWPDPSRVGRNNVVHSNCLSAGAQGRDSGGLQKPAIGFEVGPNIIERPRYAAPRRGNFRIRNGGACAGVLGSPQSVPGPGRLVRQTDNAPCGQRLYLFGAAAQLVQHLGRVLAQERWRGCFGAGGAPDRRGHQVEWAGRGMFDRERGRASGRGCGFERVRDRADLAGGDAGGLEVGEPVLRGALAEARPPAAATSTSRCSTRAALVAKRSSELSSSDPMTEHSERNSPSFAAATAIRPDDVSKAW